MTSGTCISDIEYILRKEMYELQASAEGGDPFNLPTFAGQETCPQFDPDGDEANIDKHALFELVANTKLNQASSIHPTTDAIAQRIDSEREEILRGSRRDFLACYNDVKSMIYLRRMQSNDGVGYLTLECGRKAQKSVLNLQNPRDELKEELEANNATSFAPVELSRVSHSRFGSCARDPVSGVQLDDVQMKHAHAQDYEPDAAYGIYDGITNWHEAEAVVPLAVKGSRPTSPSRPAGLVNTVQAIDKTVHRVLLFANIKTEKQKQKLR